MEDGLASNEVYQVLEDKYGNLLVASDRGVSKFDGYSFESVPFPNGLITNPVYYIYKASTGKVYFSGSKGYIYEYRGDSLADYPLNQSITKLYHHSGLLIANTLSDKNDTLWLSYNNDYKHHFQIGTSVVLPNGSVRKWLTKDGIYFDLQRKFYYRQFGGPAITNKHNLYITWPDGKTSSDSVSLSWSSGYIRRLYFEHLNGHDVFVIGRKILIYKANQKINEYLFNSNILATAVVNGQLYLGFENDGAGAYQINNGVLSNPVHTYLTGKTVTSIYMDLQGGVWFATHDNGIYYRYSSKAQFVQNPEIIQRIVKNDQHVYVCYRDGSFEKYSSGKLIGKTPSIFPRSHMLKTVSFDRQQNIILFSNYGNYTRENKHVTAGSFSSINYTSDTSLYATAMSSPELYRLNYRNKEIVQKYSLPKRIISAHFDSLTSTLWLGTWEGLFTLKDKVLSRFQSTDPLFSDRIISLGQMEDGTIVVATLGSGLALIRNGKKAQVVNTPNGLYSSLINSMSIDKNTIWLSSNKGLTRLTVTSDKISSAHYGVDAGLPSSNINELAVHNGWIYLKWDDKLVLLSAENLDKKRQPTVTRMTKVVARGMPLDQNVPARLSHDNNDVEFFFTATNLAAAKEQVYQYKLAGYDKVWQKTTERYVKYTNLPPGKYTFVVQAFTNNSSSATTSTYQFSIIPVVWQRWWFFPLALLLIISALLYMFKLRLNRLKERNQLLLSIAESKQIALVQLINPHFIFNVLNTIQAAILKQDKLNAASIIAKFGRLMRMSMELSKMKMVSLSKEIEMMQRYLELEQIRAPNKFTYEIVLDEGLDPNRVYIPAMLIQPFVENAVKHGIMHLLGNGGIVKIRFSLVHGLLYCAVEDNGIGRHQSGQINNKIRPEHESAGIHITVERLKLLHQENRTKFEYTVTDKEDERGTPAGTSILFTLPFKHNDDQHQSNNN